jgi:hypothetical protein
MEMPPVEDLALRTTTTTTTFAQFRRTIEPLLQAVSTNTQIRTDVNVQCLADRMLFHQSNIGRLRLSSPTQRGCAWFTRSAAIMGVVRQNRLRWKTLRADDWLDIFVFIQ